MAYLETRCLFCDRTLRASQHKSASERKKRDKANEYCDRQCAASYKAQTAKVGGHCMFDKFLFNRPIT